METEAAQDQSTLIGEAEYQTLAQTLMESDRGNRFLQEFLRRNKTPETQEILAAIQRLEKSVSREKTIPNIDHIKLDIADMAEAIERTKNEISSIKAEEESSNRFINASMELDAIVKHTEGATQTILEAAELIQEQAWSLRENGADNAVCDTIDEKATEIFMACSFQDLTGQRTNKVVQVLGYLESRINYIIGLWGISEVSAEDMAGPEDTRPDAHLLNGPQMEGLAVSQDNVDELMSVSAEVFDAALEDASENSAPSDEAASADDVDMSAPMDAADIDDMFASAGDDAAEDAAETAEAVVEEAEDTSVVEFEADHAPDDVLDESEIDALFDAETQDSTAEEETEADADWEQTAMEASSEADPLEKLSEAERQALFN